MESKDLFGKTFPCECGKAHRIDPREVVYLPEALELIPAVCRSLNLGLRVAVFMDARTREAAGRQAAEVLRDAGWRVDERIVEDREDGGWPVCEDKTKDDIQGRLAEVDWILTVGSGVITDLGKWVAGERDLPFVGFATAASMNGYASANVAPTIQGIKTIFRARPAVALLSSPTVLMEAPYEMTTAGLGDVLAKNTSTADWYINHLLFDDYFCRKSAGLITHIEPMYLDHPTAIRDRAPEAFEALFQALVLTGVSMTMAETSSPSSGGEHMISHALDMMSAMDGEGHDLHGRQVGIGTVLAATLYSRVLSVESPEFQVPSDLSEAGFWGPRADAVREQYAQKLPRMQTAVEKLSRGNAWDDFRRAVSPMLHPPEKIHQCLLSAVAATKPEHIGCTPSRLSRAFRHACEIRSRFTVLDLARLMGLLPAAADEIIEHWG